VIPRKTLITKSKVNGVFTDGKWTGETVINGVVIASVQPLTPRQKKSLPEGRQTVESYRLFSSSLLNTVEEQNPDIVIINGQDFEVHSRGGWQNNIISHFEYVVIKI